MMFMVHGSMIQIFCCSVYGIITYLLAYCIYYDTNYNNCYTYTNSTHTQHTDQLSELSLNKLHLFYCEIHFGTMNSMNNLLAILPIIYH